MSELSTTKPGGRRAVWVALLLVLLVVGLLYLGSRMLPLTEAIICDEYSYTRSDGVTVTPRPGDADDGCWAVPGGR